MSIGETIEELIRLNIMIWDEASQIKDFHNNPIKDLPTEDRVKHFLKVRELNATRSSIRAKIDNYFHDGVDQTKLDYYGD